MDCWRSAQFSCSPNSFHRGREKLCRRTETSRRGGKVRAAPHQRPRFTWRSERRRVAVSLVWIVSESIFIDPRESKRSPAFILLLGMTEWMAERFSLLLQYFIYYHSFQYLWASFYCRFSYILVFILGVFCCITGDALPVYSILF